MDDEIGLTPLEAVDYIKGRYGAACTPSIKTLAKLRVLGGGPEFEKFGSRVIYRARKLDAFVISRMSGPMRSTSDKGGAHAVA